LKLALDLGHALHTPMQFGTASYQLFHELQSRGQGTQDFTSIIKLAEEVAGVEARFERSETH
jgi:3-hydroxyisobutyrate dehydrogenase-like beta-hydroxyacid dehydrogenase